MTLAPGIDRMPAASGSEAPIELVSMHVAGQLVGIPVRTVRDVLGPQRIARVPRASPAIAGVSNLRGRIVTVLDLRARLGIPPAPNAGARLRVVDGDGEVHLPAVIASVYGVSSSEARRMIRQGGVKLDGESVPGDRRIVPSATWSPFGRAGARWPSASTASTTRS